MRKRTGALLLGAVVALAGCNAINRDEGARLGTRIDDARAPEARINLDTVVILDKSLQDRRSGKIAIESSGARRTETGTLQVHAVIRNRTDHPQQIELRTTYFDEFGVPVEGPTSWQRVYLDAQAVGGYRELSARVDGIAHYYIEMREGR